MTTLLNRKGYSEDTGGYSGPFRWWVSFDRRKYLVAGFSQFSRGGWAVIDDFGTLVEVDL